MIYLTGSSGPLARSMARRLPLGFIVQPGTRSAQIAHYRWYAADNGCFNPASYIGHRRWVEWVRTLPPDRCLFVVVPDVARRPDGELGGDPEATWRRFTRLAPYVRAAGFPAALVAQDGLEAMGNVDEQLAACDALFLGGSTEWKTSPAALDLAAHARELGRWTHMGRVNTAARYRLACAALVDSADGTFLRYGPNANAPRLERWLLAGAQLTLAL